MTHEEIMRRAASGQPFKLYDDVDDTVEGMRLVSRGVVVSRPRMDDNYEQLLKQYKDFTRAVAEIKANRDWSDEGRRKQIQKMATDLLPKIDSYKSVVEQGRKSLAAMYRPLPTPPGDAVAATVAMEIRQRMAGLDPLDLQLKLTEAIENNDVTVFSALINDPLGMVPAKLVDDAKRAWTSKPLPGEEEEASELESTTNKMEYLINSSIGDIRREAGMDDNFTTVKGL